MADLIDRDALLKDLRSECPESDVCISSVACIDCIVNRQPSANPWIPCSERMPENCTKVLVWFEYFRYGEYNCMYSTWGIGEYFDFSGIWLIDDSTGWQDLHVFAWMPLPAPPEGGNQE